MVYKVLTLWAIMRAASEASGKETGMRLSLQTIARLLPWSAAIGTSRGAGPLFGRPLLYAAGGTILPDALYIARAADLPVRRPSRQSAWICVGGGAPDSWEKSVPGTISLPDADDPAAVLSAVHAIFDEFDSWERELLEELAPGDAFDMLSFVLKGIELVHGQFSFMDPSLRVTISCSEDSQGNIAVSNIPRHLTPQEVDGMRQVCVDERPIRVPFFSNMPGRQEGRTYCKNIYDGDVFLGCATFTKYGTPIPFEPEELLAANRFFELFAQTFHQRAFLKSYGAMPKEELVKKVVEHAPLTQQERMALQLKAGKRWVCIVLKRADAGSMPLDYMHAALNVLPSDNVYAMSTGASVAAIVRLQAAGSEAAGTEWNELEGVVRRMGYVGGASGGFERLDLIDFHLAQARFAADRAVTPHDDAALVQFRSCRTSFMLDAGMESVPIETVTSEGLSSLLSYDAEKGTDYVHTLAQYLLDESNTTHAARNLYVHRSSLIKRLERIEAITGEPLDDSETRLYYRMWFKLREARGIPL